MDRAENVEVEQHTLCFSRSSLLKGALMMTRRTLDGASKWALRDFLREEWIAGDHLSSANRHVFGQEDMLIKGLAYPC